ncbi:MAG: S-methyl-5'-thioadenosine phosphorylase [Deltaproteobacteria bacterium]|nr:S-methyl-5'-thioadenosine phosphorylase [Candidatus Anaeroferrophillus wilburensis]MBN2888250.1 S-methyl-5'-thioadenosine phosphorylase [Deltaproteobacteria bacterium]
MTTIGIIGGSGLYEMEGLSGIREVSVDTPFGSPSASLVTGQLGEAHLVFLPRHGRGHTILPAEINFRANIYALKQLGVQQILSISAVGSMKEEIRPGEMVIVDQFIDRTSGRPSTFFGDGIVGHIPFADPVCPVLRRQFQESCRALQIPFHARGTYICINGPQFSTRAESRLYRQWGVDVIGMTNMPEARLAREAQICYATLALATDYDCWKEDHDDVSVDAVLEIIHQNVENAKKIIREMAGRATPESDCSCPRALENAVLTNPDHITSAAREKLRFILPA